MRRAALTVVTVLWATAAHASAVAIIIHPSNPQRDVTLADLSRLFRLDQPRWKSGDKVEVVLQAGVSAKQDVMLSRVFHMKASEMNAFWLGKVFRGEMAAPPRTFASDVSVRQYVAANPGAIGYVDAALVDESVRVMHIDGKAPGDLSYPLAREAPTVPPTSTAAPPEQQTSRPQQ